MKRLRHWLQFDHITFILAMVLVFLNIFQTDRRITITVAVILFMAFVYDLGEEEEE